MAKSTTHANEVLDTIGYSSASAMGDTWISLHTSDPGTNGANEVDGGNYGRVKVNRNRSTAPYWAAASNGEMVTGGGAVVFPQGGGDAEVTHFGVWSAEEGGTFRRGGELEDGFTYTAATIPEFAAGALGLSET